VLEVAGQGVTFGSALASGEAADSLGSAALLEEAVRSRQTLEHVLQASVTTIAPAGLSDTRATFGSLAELVRLLRPYWQGFGWLAPLVLLLGLVASLAEGAGIGVIFVLLSTLLRGGGASNAAAGGGDLIDGGLLDRVLGHVATFTGGNVPLLVGLVILFVLLRMAV
jgi:hypothetical protein